MRLHVPPPSKPTSITSMCRESVSLKYRRTKSMRLMQTWTPLFWPWSFKRSKVSPQGQTHPRPHPLSFSLSGSGQKRPAQDDATPSPQVISLRGQPVQQPDLVVSRGSSPVITLEGRAYHLYSWTATKQEARQQEQGGEENEVRMLTFCLLSRPLQHWVTKVSWLVVCSLIFLEAP